MLDVCSAHSGCNATDANKECSNGGCVCKTGYYADVDDVCIRGKELIDRYWSSIYDSWIS